MTQTEKERLFDLARRNKACEEEAERLYEGVRVAVKTAEDTATEELGYPVKSDGGIYSDKFEWRIDNGRYDSVYVETKVADKPESRIERISLSSSGGHNLQANEVSQIVDELRQRVLFVETVVKRISIFNVVTKHVANAVSQYRKAKKDIIDLSKEEDEEYRQLRKQQKAEWIKEFFLQPGLVVEVDGYEWHILKVGKVQAILQREVFPGTKSAYFDTKRADITRLWYLQADLVRDKWLKEKEHQHVSGCL